MGLAGRAEVLLDAEVHRHRARAEPAAAPRRQRLGLGQPHQPEEARVEGLRLRLAARGHGQLHVVEPDDLEAHGCLLDAGTDLAVDPGTASLPHDMGSLIKKRRKRMRKKKHKKMLKATRWQRRAGK